MTYLLDTNVISETRRPTPDERLISWLDKVPDDFLHISVLTVGEIRKGVETLPSGQKKQQLQVWLERSIPEWFGARVLPVSFGVADRWGQLIAQAGRSLPVVDSLIAATALRHNLRLVTRNAQDFQYPGLEVINPWQHGR